MPQVRKRLLHDLPLQPQISDGELDLVAVASIAYSSEEPAHPVDCLFDGQDGPDGTFWQSARENSRETLIIEFDHRQSISQLIFEAGERHRERTQEVHVEVSCDGGNSFRRLLVQEFTFSPGGATFQHEDLRIGIEGVSHFRLIVVPNKNGSGRAQLTSLRLFA